MTRDFATFRHQGLLGTIIDISVRATEDDATRATDVAAVSEIERLQAVFDKFDPESDLRSWQAGRRDPTAMLLEVLGIARTWWERTDGVFDPTSGWLYEVWVEAEASGTVPDPTELEIAVSDRAVPFSGTSTLPDPSRIADVDLNGIAKGWIVDQAVDHAMSGAVRSLVVNAGGDLLHRGEGQVRVGIENPHRPHDNEPPIVRIDVSNAALATSGGARRFWTIDGHRHPRLLDPRTGVPTARLASASVVAADAVTADVLATVVTIVGAEEGLALVDSLEATGGIGIACVEHDGRIVMNDVMRSMAIR